MAEKTIPAPPPVTAETEADAVRLWLAEISEARQREKDWRKEAARILKIYNGEKRDAIPFNVLYSNTETLVPALYNSTPRPVVQRRFKDEDSIGKVASQAGQRILEYEVDTNSEKYASFDDVLTDAVLDALLPGRGASMVKYDAEITQETGPDGQPMEKVAWELVCFESIKWDRWIFGFARKWSRVPWIAIWYEIDKIESERLFGADVTAKMTFTSESADADNAEGQGSDKTARDDEVKEERKTATVYKIWDKIGGRKIRFISPSCKENFLKVEEDNLQLEGFYPIPRPLRMLQKANDLMPTPIYMLYENQAKELNRITTRINKIVEALKVRGAYDSTVEELDDLLKKEDNVLVPASNVAALYEKGGLEKAIWLMPIDKLVTVLQQLILARQQCKQVIYEITGISDILRGQTVASETLGAQKIKEQWATLRLKRMQKEVARYARDLLRLALELSANKLGEQTIKAITGMPFPTQDEKMQATMLAQAATAQGAQVPQEVIIASQAPSWQQILGTLRDDQQRQYRIDIETNSTVDIEATEDQKHIAEVLTAISQFVQGVSPLIESGAMPFQVAQSMLLAVVRRYRFGPEVEDYIKQMQPPKPPDDGKKEAAMVDLQVKKMEAQNREKELMLEAEFKKEEHAMKLAEMRAKGELALLMARIKTMEANNKIRVLEAQAAMPVKTKEPASAA